MTPQEQKLNLIKLADFLATLPDVQYDHSIFGVSKAGCGTVACALGWAGLSGLFPFFYDLRLGIFTSKVLGEYQIAKTDLNGGLYGWDIANSVFGEGTYRRVFSTQEDEDSETYNFTREEVIERLREEARGEQL